jgi:shikimate dehydrogenase
MSERRHFILIGHPVRHTVSPAMHTAAFRALGLPHAYSALDVPSARGLGHVVDDIREGALDGANVTVPYKRAVLDLVDEVDPSARSVGAANVLVRTRDGRVVAHNTDAAALVFELERLRAGRPLGSAAIIGAGGAGLAALAACTRIGIPLIGITTRSWANSESLETHPSAIEARRLGALASPWPGLDGETAPTSRSSLVLRLQWCELAARADLILQATSAGMAGGEAGEDVASMVPWDMLESNALAYDLVYVPRITPFVREARSRKLRAESGLGMLVEQAARSFELWLGRRPPTDVMWAAAEPVLEELEVELAVEPADEEDEWGH